MEILSNENGWLRIKTDGFSVFKTFDCGQCFRFDPVEDANFDHRVDGVAFGRSVSFAEKEGDLFVRSDEEDFNNIWKNYLQLEVDYKAIDKKIVESLPLSDQSHMRLAVETGSGIRILRQDPWEALCSFIVSQNNNIPRIKKIISAMSEKYGENIGSVYTFPTAKSLFEAGEAEIFALRTGFRAKYIFDAAKKVHTGELDLNKVASAATYEEAAEMLMSVSGVGPKVAACTLLFGFGRTDAFPIDVWIKKVIEKRFPNGLDKSVFGNEAGIAQQYLFYYERYIEG
ncbi:MAG: DNA-3-methyladenine glycosylase 2 family protein [Clostridia bacterium]|nr:DNA-3-methyladenine glycosylase 2 family protein [Clostridia bacterium]MBR6651364.1 DNA-3-methyladenine glycosylase 2 family protein [Clostridia bacterium]